MCLKGLIDMIIETSRRKRYTYTKSLLHFDGTDGSTTFTDETGKMWTGYGSGTALKTANKKFGTASGYLYNSISGNKTSYLISGHTSDFILEKNAFTIDFWATLYDKTTSYVLFSLGTTSDGIGGLLLRTQPANWDPDRHGLILAYANASTIASYDELGIFNSSFYHVAIIGNGAIDGSRNIKIYINGALKITAGINYNFSSDIFYLGASSYFDDCSNIYIDEFRISKGIQRWTSNFTPPTSAYTLD